MDSLRCLKSVSLWKETHSSAANDTTFPLCSDPTTVIFVQRLYEVSEDKKPECGVETVLLALEDWLRLSADAYFPPVAPLLVL